MSLIKVKIINRLMSSCLDVYDVDKIPVGSPIPPATYTPEASNHSLVRQKPSFGEVTIEGSSGGIFIATPTGTTVITPNGMSQSINTYLTAKFISIVDDTIVSSSPLSVSYNKEYQNWFIDLTPVYEYANKRGGNVESTNNMVVVDDEP